MSLLRYLPVLLCCCLFSYSISAQKAIKKAELYTANAPFLSIKYFQKHLEQSSSDKSAMLKLADCYQKVEMSEQRLKWLLKAHDCKDLSAFYKKVLNNHSTMNALQQNGSSLLKNQVRYLYQRDNVNFMTYPSSDKQTRFVFVLADVVSRVL